MNISIRTLLLILVLLVASLVAWWVWLRPAISSNAYRNSKYGFEMDFPASMEPFAVREETYNDGTGMVSFVFALKKKNGETGPDAWYINLWPKKEWGAYSCDPSEEMCYKGPEIGERNGYVFEKGYVSDLAGENCVAGNDFLVEERNYCSAYQALSDFVKHWNSTKFKVD